MIIIKRSFHNYFAKNALKNILKKENINYNDIYKKIYIGNSIYNGLGVFSLDIIKKNEVIEVCPTIEIENEQIPKILVDCLFESEQENINKKIVDILTKKKETTNYKLLPLGHGMLYNHSSTPNAFVQIFPITQKKETVTCNKIMIFYAQQDIQKNEEIFISYGESWWNVCIYYMCNIKKKKEKKK
ncbi:histone-lysine N-methyltransferase, putative [Plasmodium relictum]|uniref:Histone-lysine N-methyltransferase, putative n=1 Tax=Plasmodium relictum TaxID=85471 RepID=A0A1J1HAZ0_PLARL|nr:histone-lysine N-methyltransferase, putative [Plasmodium relictum]CRH02571.1 histone-lysine N-methyltransferase, putative [Plasmodium relictum]